MKITSEQKRIYNVIDTILWEDWDPIGINDNEDIRDEYQSYTPQIFKLKIQNADEYKIAKQLFGFEIQDMGLSGNIEHCQFIARKIIEIE